MIVNRLGGWRFNGRPSACFEHGQMVRHKPGGRKRPRSKGVLSKTGKIRVFEVEIVVKI